MALGAVSRVRHRLSLAIRFVDHFSGRPVDAELPVRLAGSFQRPARTSGGAGYRQDDGSYRFLSAAPGPATVLWRAPFARSHAGWTRWDSDPVIALPRADAMALVDVALWPTPDAVVPAGATGLRGKIEGPDAGGLTIRVAPLADPFDRFTRTDASGAFLFLPQGRLSATPTGTVPMKIDVLAPDGTPRAVLGGRFAPASAGPAFAGPAFTLTPATVLRILFQIA
jgi:hypothetical protein